eukprot:GHVU01155347.1.p1 GENE.GHVU01155347.1~~GHVU01155347.1.p1  ORF type:complete len:376 (+),score=71.72 GHVU01155347.1:577-1704(+)
MAAGGGDIEANPSYWEAALVIMMEMRFAAASSRSRAAVLFLLSLQLLLVSPPGIIPVAEGVRLCPGCRTAESLLTRSRQRKAAAARARAAAAGVFSAAGAKNSAYVRRRGYVEDLGGLKVDNQDEFLLLNNTPCRGWRTYAAFDGHGFEPVTEPQPGGSSPSSAAPTATFSGSHAARLARNFFLKQLADRPSLWTADYCDNFRDEYESFFNWLFKKADESIGHYGGTTATLLLHDVASRDLYVAYVGDSRALLVERDVDDAKQPDLADESPPKYFTTRLTPEDHRPFKGSGEEERLQAAGFASSIVNGRLEAPGESLGISRSLGDHAYDRFGRIATPTTGVYELSKNSEFIVVATDGLWDFVPDNVVGRAAAVLR